MRNVLAVSIIIATFSIATLSQTASILIRFRDPSCQQRPIKGVVVKVLGSHFSKTLKSGASGFISVSKVPSGPYRVTTRKFGFKDYIIDIELASGLPFEHTYDLERGYASSDYDRTVNNPRYDPCK